MHYDDRDEVTNRAASGLRASSPSSAVTGAQQSPGTTAPTSEPTWSDTAITAPQHRTAAATPGGASARQPTVDLRRPVTVSTPTRVGRFAILRELGRGGMGVAYLAYDEHLDRRVAVKILQPDAAFDEDIAAHERLLREAQALARLAHPNIVAVYEVGSYQSQVYVAMEFIRGYALKKWLQEQRRHWREVLRIFQQVGAGLVAAHAAGLVHRDINPNNVMVGEDGRVRVVDFGLACSVGAPLMPDGATEVVTAAGNSSLDVPLTKTGVILGTPGYLAPEQLLHGTVDAQIDQFAFCVSLYEALYGELPFAGDSAADRRYALFRGQVKDAPLGTQVPGWLRAVVLRGLQPDPNHRWPSMAALLTAMQHDPAKRRRTWMTVAASLASMAVVAMMARASAEDPGGYVCSGASQQLAAVWSDQQRGQMRQAVLATEVSYAATTWAQVELQLDDYTRDWAHAHKEACEATAVRKEQSAEVLDQRMACLRERQHALGALIDALIDIDTTTVAGAVVAASQLPRVDACADPNYLNAHIKPPDDPDIAATVASLNSRLLYANELLDLSAYDKALDIVEEVVDGAEGVDHPPLHAWLSLVRGRIQAGKGEFRAAEASLEAAFFAARELRYDEVAIAAALDLTEVVGIFLGRYDDGNAWARHAQAEMHPMSTEEQQMTLLSNTGRILLLQGAYADGAENQVRAFDIAAGIFGPEHPITGTQLYHLATTRYRQQRLEEAKHLIQRAIAIQERALGADNPNLADGIYVLGMINRAAAKYEQAEQSFRRVLAIYDAASDSNHPQVGLVLANLGWVKLEQGRAREADTHLGRAVTIYEQSWEKGHPVAILVVALQAWAALELGRTNEAVNNAAHAVEILESKATDPMYLAMARFILARALAAKRGARVRARALEVARRARDTYEQAGAAGAAELAKVNAWIAAQEKVAGQARRKGKARRKARTQRL